MDFRNITSEVEAVVRKSGVSEGLVLVKAMHITARPASLSTTTSRDHLGNAWACQGTSFYLLLDAPDEPRLVLRWVFVKHLLATLPPYILMILHDLFLSFHTSHN